MDRVSIITRAPISASLAIGPVLEDIIQIQAFLPMFLLVQCLLALAEIALFHIIYCLLILNVQWNFPAWRHHHGRKSWEITIVKLDVCIALTTFGPLPSCLENVQGQLPLTCKAFGQVFPGTLRSRGSHAHSFHLSITFSDKGKKKTIQIYKWLSCLDVLFKLCLVTVEGHRFL